MKRPGECGWWNGNWLLNRADNYHFPRRLTPLPARVLLRARKNRVGQRPTRHSGISHSPPGVRETCCSLCLNRRQQALTLPGGALVDRQALVVGLENSRSRGEPRAWGVGQPNVLALTGH